MQDDLSKLARLAKELEFLGSDLTLAIQQMLDYIEQHEDYKLKFEELAPFYNQLLELLSQIRMYNQGMISRMDARRDAGPGFSLFPQSKDVGTEPKTASSNPFSASGTVSAPSRPRPPAVPPYGTAPDASAARCTVCGSPIPPGSSFCTACGSRVRAESAPVKPAPAAPSRRCRVCGSPIPVGNSFCTVCGSPAQTEIATARMDHNSPAYASPQAAFSEAQEPESGEELSVRRVEFSAIAPKRLVKGDYTLLSVVMYEKSHRRIVEQIIREMDAEAQEKRSGVHQVEDGAEIRVVLSSPDLELEDNEETRIWAGEYLDFSFAVFLPEDFKKRQILFQAAVYIDGVIATRLKFIVRCFSLLEQKISVSREDVLSAFVSYASEDRDRVATIIQGMQKARPDMDVFFDVDSLRSGEGWEQALQREISRRDVLYLCWSQNARRSRWVDTEWRYAYSQKGEAGIEPIPIDSPDVCPPPQELSGKHFNDRLLYIINASHNP